MVASEAAPWAKTGGLADVVAALPDALAALGHHVTIVMPKYRRVVAAGASTTSRTIRFGVYAHDVTFHVIPLDTRRRVVFVDRPPLFDRDGLYGAGGRDYDDNAERFALLAVAALDFAEHDDAAPPASVVHA